MEGKSAAGPSQCFDVGCVMGGRCRGVDGLSRVLLVSLAGREGVG